MYQLSDGLLAAVSCIEPVYVDGIAGFLNLGQNFATIYYRLQPVICPSEGMRYDKVPVASIIRPKGSIVHCGVNGACGFANLIGKEVLAAETSMYGSRSAH